MYTNQYFHDEISAGCMCSTNATLPIRPPSGKSDRKAGMSMTAATSVDSRSVSLLELARETLPISVGNIRYRTSSVHNVHDGALSE